MAAVQQNISYKKELRAGDAVTIRTTILEVREKVMRFVHEMVKEPTLEIAAIAELTGVHMDARRRRSIELPPGILANVRELISQQKENATSIEEFLDAVPDGTGEIAAGHYAIPTGLGYTSMCE
jgi:acyl-CoA thioester hydrolase